MFRVVSSKGLFGASYAVVDHRNPKHQVAACRSEAEADMVCTALNAQPWAQNDTPIGGEIEMPRGVPMLMPEGKWEHLDGMRFKKVA